MGKGSLPPVTDKMRATAEAIRWRAKAAEYRRRGMIDDAVKADFSAEDIERPFRRSWLDRAIDLWIGRAPPA